MMKLDKSAVLASAAALTSSLACAAQPNVVFILADDMGYGDVSALNENPGYGPRPSMPSAATE